MTRWSRSSGLYLSGVGHDSIHQNLTKSCNLTSDGSQEDEVVAGGRSRGGTG